MVITKRSQVWVVRVPVLALALMLALAPLGLAESGSESSSTSGSPDAAAKEDCADADTPREREECLRAAGNETDGNETADDGNETEESDEPRPAEWCRDGARTAEQKERCRRAVDAIRDEERRDWVTFDVDPANATLLDYRIAGMLALESIDLDLDQGNLSIERDGSTLRVRAGDDELRLHDEPNGLMRFKGDGNVTLTFPDGADIQADAHGARILYPSGRSGQLLAQNATWLDNATVQLTGFFAFHVPPAGALARDEPKLVREAEEGKRDAIERRTLGAEVTLKARPSATGLAAMSDEAVEVLAYDDVEVHVDLPDAAAASGAPLRVVVSSELDEGRTIVLNVDESLLASIDPADLVLRYFDLHNQTDGSVLETEVLFAAAGSLQDVLEPADDGGQPEYWVVQDANGVQVLVSVPHWSAHAITVGSVLSDLDVPSVLVGISVGAAMTIGLSVALLWPRRRDDDL